MIYLFCALYPEAAALISHYGLKKDTAENRFQVFLDAEGEICLTITGPGEIAAAAAVSSICTKYQADRGGMLVNLGTCAAVALSGEVLTGSVFLCNRLTEAATGKTFYPDILYRHRFCERGIVTGMKIIDGTGNGFSTGFCGIPDKAFAACAEDGFFLYDMEAAAIYQAGAYFFGPHQMSFIKIVSDVEIPKAEAVPAGGKPEQAALGKPVSGNPAVGKLSKEEIMRLMEANRENITTYIDLLRAAGREKTGGGARTADGYDMAFAEKLCRDMCCSQTMQTALCQHLRYCALVGINYHAAAEKMYCDGRLPCRDKREGKLRLEELKRELL